MPHDDFFGNGTFFRNGTGAGEHPADASRRALRLGIGGPVGSGKTALVAALCKQLREELALAVVTNDIYTTEDADFLRRAAVLPDERICAVRTGCCPHTAIRDDITANLEAADELERHFAPLDLLIIESGGDNLTATFSRGLADAQVFVLDVSGGDKVPRKGGPGVSLSDLLVINKTDLAGHVGADLSVMARDADQVRRGRPVIFSSLREHPDAPEVTDWVRAVVRAWARPEQAGLTARAAVATQADRDGGTRITALRSDGPIALRDTPGGVYLVGAAAGPVGGDDLELEIDVGPGTTLALRSAAASLLLPGPRGHASRLRIRAHVGAGGRLDYCPQPAVAAAGCDHHASAAVELEPGAVLRWREAVVLGRHGEPAGQCVSRLDVSVAGTALYRGELTVGRRDTDGSCAVLDGAGAAGSVLVVDAARAQPQPEVLDGLAILPLAGPGCAISAIAPDAARLASRLDHGEQVAGYWPVNSC